MQPERRLTIRQLAIAGLTGVAGWFAAALAIRSMEGSAMTAGGAATVLLFALTLPVAFASAWLLDRLAGLSGQQRATGMAVAIAAATLCDGIALTWFAALYGSGADHLRVGAALILWGAGCFLLVALYRASRLSR